MKKVYFLTTYLLGLGVCGHAAGFDNDGAEVPSEQGLAAYMPNGISAGSFLVLPKLDIINEYDSNIFRRDKQLGTVDSYIARFRPGFDVKSRWSRHALNFSFDSDLALYATQGSNTDYQDIFTRLDGRLDVLRDSFMDMAFSFNSLHEQRGSPDQVAGVSPTFYDTKRMEWYYTHKFNRVSVKGGLDATRFDYRDTPTSTGAILDMNSRSHWEFLPTIRLGYEIQPEYEAFVKAIYKNADYDRLVLSNGAGPAFNRDSYGYNVLGGMAFDLTGLITGDFSVGYLYRNYADPALQTIAGINGFVNLKWRPTALTTVTGNVSHDIKETTQVDVAGVLDTGVRLGVEHELLRNVILKAGANYDNLQYQGFNPTNPIVENRHDRTDNLYGGTVGVKYLLNRNFSTDLSYIYQNRDANYLFTNYEVHQVMLNVTGQF